MYCGSTWSRLVEIDDVIFQRSHSRGSGGKAASLEVLLRMKMRFLNSDDTYEVDEVYDRSIICSMVSRPMSWMTPTITICGSVVLRLIRR